MSSNKQKNKQAIKQSAGKQQQRSANLLSDRKSQTNFKWLYLIIFLAGFGLYANTLQHNYVYDDVSVIGLNKFTKMGIDGIPTLFTKAYWYGFRGENDGTYRPLSLITFALEYEYFGENAHVPHFVNVFLYALSGVFLFWFLVLIYELKNPLQRGLSSFFAFIVSLFYIAHPVHTEVVANIKGRDEILCFLLFLISFIYLLKYIKNAGSSFLRKIFFLAISILSFYLSILSKETAVTFVAVIPLVLFVFTNFSSKKILQTSSIFVIITIVYLIMRGSFLDSIAGSKPLIPIDNTLAAATTFSEKYATAIYILGKYLGLLLFPHPLIYDYSFKQIAIVDWSNIYALISLVVYASMLIYAIRGIKDKSIVSFGILYYLITMSIVSNLFLMIGSTMAERFLYIPSLGFCIAVGYLLIRLFKIEGTSNSSALQYFKQNISLMIVLAVVFILYSFKTVSRNLIWKDNLTLYSTDIVNAENSSRAHLFYGQELLELAKVEPEKNKRKDLFDKTIKEITRSSEIDPTYSDTWLNLGIAYVENGDNAEGIKNYKRVLQINPFYDKAYYNMGNAYFNLKDFTKAKECFENAIKYNNAYKLAYYNLGNTYMKIDQNEKAIEYYHKTLQLDPYYIDVYNNMGNAYTNLLKFDDAIASYKKAIVLKPQYALLHNNMGNVYNQIKNYDEAIKCFNTALKFDPKYTSALNNLGAAYYYKGNYDKAITYFEKVLKIDPSQKDMYNNIGLCYQNKGEIQKAQEYFSKAR